MVVFGLLSLRCGGSSSATAPAAGEANAGGGDANATGGNEVCSSGETRRCVGAGGCTGGQLCREGTWTACDCGTATGGSTSSGGTPSAGQSSVQGGGMPETSLGGAGGETGCSGLSCECAEGSLDCDTTPGCETNVSTDSMNCGRCGHVCAGPHASASCAKGSCVCDAGFGDCTDSPGCETDTRGAPKHCGACGNVCGSGECVAGSCSSRAFLTSKLWYGDLGGLSGADSKCQALADAAKLGGTFKAWLGDGFTSPLERFPHSTAPYRSVTGELIAEDWDRLVAVNANPQISVDETGKAYPSIDVMGVWTGLEFGQQGITLSMSCDGWTVAPVDGVKGEWGSPGNGSWLDRGNTTCGQMQHRLYCFEVSPL